MKIFESQTNFSLSFSLSLHSLHSMCENRTVTKKLANFKLMSTTKHRINFIFR